MPDPEVIKKEREIYKEAMSERLPDTVEEEEVIWSSILARRDQLKQVRCMAYLVETLDKCVKGYNVYSR